MPDALIAATALELGVPLVTRNRRDFDAVPDLTILTRGPASKAETEVSRSPPGSELRDATTASGPWLDERQAGLADVDLEDLPRVGIVAGFKVATRHEQRLAEEREAQRMIFSASVSWLTTFFITSEVMPSVSRIWRV